MISPTVIPIGEFAMVGVMVNNLSIDASLAQFGVYAEVLTMGGQRKVIFQTTYNMTIGPRQMITREFHIETGQFEEGTHTLLVGIISADNRPIASAQYDFEIAPQSFSSESMGESGSVQVVESSRLPLELQHRLGITSLGRPGEPTFDSSFFEFGPPQYFFCTLGSDGLVAVLQLGAAAAADGAEVELKAGRFPSGPPDTATAVSSQAPMTYGSQVVQPGMQHVVLEAESVGGTAFSAGDTVWVSAQLLTFNYHPNFNYFLYVRDATPVEVADDVFGTGVPYLTVLGDVLSGTFATSFPNVPHALINTRTGDGILIERASVYSVVNVLNSVDSETLPVQAGDTISIRVGGSFNQFGTEVGQMVVTVT